MNESPAEALLEEVRQIRKLLELVAEPAIAQRDAKLRDALLKAVGASKKMQASTLVMDGTLTQSQIVKATGVDQGQLSAFVGKLDSAGLLADGRKLPKLAIALPRNFFEAKNGSK